MKQVLTASTGTHTGTIGTDNTNINQQDMSTHEPAAKPAQPLPTNVTQNSQLQSSSTLAQLLKKQKSPSTLQASLLAQQKLGITSQTTSKLNSLLGKRSVLQMQAGQKSPLMSNQVPQKEEKILSNISNDVDEKQRLLKSKLGQMIGSTGVSQGPQNLQLMSNPLNGNLRTLMPQRTNLINRPNDLNLRIQQSA